MFNGYQTLTWLLLKTGKTFAFGRNLKSVFLNCYRYSTDNPERVTMIHIDGDIIDITRDSKKTEVIIDEGIFQ